MQSSELLQIVATWPGVTNDIKWEHDLVLSVCGKMFCVMATAGDRKGALSFKVEEGRFLEFTDRDGIIPAPYLARAKWVQVLDPRALNGKELHILVRRSYELVRDRLTRREQNNLVEAERKNGSPRPLPSAKPVVPPRKQVAGTGGKG